MWGISHLGHLISTELISVLKRRDMAEDTFVFQIVKQPQFRIRRTGEAVSARPAAIPSARFLVLSVVRVDKEREMGGRVTRIGSCRKTRRMLPRRVSYSSTLYFRSVVVERGKASASLERKQKAESTP